MVRQDPGPCPICGAAHTACGADSGPITVVQLPARDALAMAPVAPTEPDLPPVVVAESAPFSTAEYDRKKHGLKRGR
jgi:hypothetical protein